MLHTLFMLSSLQGRKDEETSKLCEDWRDHLTGRVGIRKLVPGCMQALDIE